MKRVAVVLFFAGCLANVGNPLYTAGTQEGNPTAPSTDWPTLQGNNMGWGWYPDAVVAPCNASPVTDWDDCVVAEWKVTPFNVKPHTAPKGSAVAFEGTIYVGSDNGTLHAFKPNGTELWRAATEWSGNGIHGTPTVADGRVFIGAYDGAMYAFDAHGGERLWRTQVGDYIGSSPRVWDGHVYIAVEHGGSTTVRDGLGAYGTVQRLDASTGQVVWISHQLAGHPHAPLALSVEDNVFVAANNWGHLDAWDLDDLEHRWHFEVDGRFVDMKGPVMIWDGAAFIASWNREYSRIDLETGQRDWVFRAGNFAMSGSAVDPRTGILYFGSHDGNVYALDATTGDEVWRRQFSKPFTSSPVLTPNVLLFAGKDGFLHALDPATGDRFWSYAAKNPITSTPLVVGDRIIFADRSEADQGGGHGQLYGLAPR